MFVDKFFKKPIERKIHTFPLLEKDLTKEVWMALHSVGTPVTFEQDVLEHDGVKEISYDVSVLTTQDEWDRMNRRLGKLGIDEIQTKATAD